MCRVVVALFLAVLLCGCNALLFFGDGPAADVTTLRQADFLFADVAAPPANDDPRWQRVELPDIWSQRTLVERGGWYRLRHPLPAPPVEIQGVYLYRLNLNAAVYLNGVFLGDGGRFDEPMTRNWNVPLYFTVPPALWRAGDNQLLIRLRAYPGYGIFPPVQLGPERVLRPIYEQRSFLQLEVTAILCFALIGLSLFMFGIYWRRRKDTLYLWFAGATMLWALFSAYLFVRNPIVPGPAWQWFAHVCIDWWSAILAGFVHRYVGQPRPRLERAFLGCAALGTLCTAVAPDHLWRAHEFRFFHALSLGIAVYLTIYTWWAFLRRRAPELGLLAGALLVLMLAGVHDWALAAPTRWVPRQQLSSVYGHSFFFLHYAAPLVFLFLGWHLTRRFVNALNESEQWNVELEARVEKGRQQLERSFAERRQLEREQAATEARERIYRDLHDDIGAKLLSLAIGADSPRQADLARGALRELRDVVSHSSRGETPLLELLADCRFEISERVQAAKLKLTWHEATEPPALTLPTYNALNLSRILREAVSNVLHHARASQVSVIIEPGGDALSLSIVDDGVGIGAAPIREGRGMRNLRARATLLGGEITWSAASPHGCCLQLRVPLHQLTRIPSHA